MDFDPWMTQAWADHADHADAVAERLQTDGLALASTDPQAARLAHLAHHVFGDHLGAWGTGRAWLQQLAALTACPPGGPAAAAVRLYRASLALCAGTADDGHTLGSSDAIRVAALAAGTLAERDPARAKLLFDQALAGADAAGLPAKDPANRTLAATGNALACTFELKADRSAAERELMVLAAQTARRCWELAGTWLEVERAEYRLAMTWVQAGDLVRARGHAQRCLEIVQAKAAPALEHFFGWEALGVVERAAGNATAHAHALAQAEVAFEGLEEGDRGWCQVELDKLRHTAA